MLKKTIIKWHHVLNEKKGTREYENSLRKNVRNCDVFSFELGENLKNIVVSSFERDWLKAIKGIKNIQLSYPFNILLEEAVKYQKPVIFLERKTIPEKNDSSSQKEKVEETRKEVLAKKADFKDLERELDYLCFKFANEITYKDDDAGKEMDFMENKIRILLQREISLPEEIDFSIFMGAYHSLENQVKDKETLFILIPDAGSYDQEQLYMDIITSKVIQEHKPYLLCVKYLAELGNSIFASKIDKEGIGLSEFKVLFRKFYKNDLQKLDNIRGRKVPYEEFYNIMKDINTDKIADIIKDLNQTLGNQIALSHYIDKRKKKIN